MKTKINSSKAKTKFPELARQAKADKSFATTNDGAAVAGSVPSKDAETKDKVAATDKLKSFMLTDPVRGVNFRDLIEEGRV